MLTSHGFSRAAVVGAGLMGRRIAGVLASAGLDVAITDTNAEILHAAAVEAARVAGAGRGSVAAAADLAAAIPDADLVIEAVVENLAVKQELFERLATLAPDAVLATNTSVLPIGAVTERVEDGSRVIGTHFWNPPDLIPVVEVVPSARTAPDTADRVVALLTQVGKLPVRVGRDVPGFIGNRLQHALWREAIALVAEGVCDPKTVDLVVRNTIGLRLATLGPLENADYIGLDLTLAIHDAVIPSLNHDPHPSPLLRNWSPPGNSGRVPVTAFWTGPQEPARPPPPDLPSTSPRNSKPTKKEGGHSHDVRLAPRCRRIDVGVLRPVPPWGHGAPAWPYFEDVQIERLHGMAKSRVLTQRSPPSCIPAPTSTRRRTWWKEHRFWTRSR